MTRIIIESTSGQELEVERGTFDAGYFPGYWYVRDAGGSSSSPGVPAYIDADMAAAVDDPTSQTSARLRAALVPKWKASTAYAPGEFVLNPSGQIVSANAAFTSGATYIAANWTVAAGAVSSVAGQTGAVTGAQIAADTSVKAAFAPFATTQRAARTRGATVTKVRVGAYATGHGWTQGGGGLDGTNSNLNDTAQFDIGSQSLKIVTNATAGDAHVGKTLTAAVDVSDCNVRLRFRLTDMNLNTLNVQVGNSTFSQVNQVTLMSLNGQTSTIGWPAQTGRWAVVDIPQSAFSQNCPWTAIQRLQVQVIDKSAVTTVNVAELSFVKKDAKGTGPIAVFTLDDGYGSQDSIVRPALTAQGWKATVLPIVDTLDTGTNLTTAQVQAMHDTYGWEVGAHSFTNAAHALGYPAMSQGQRVSELESILAWMDGYGFTSRSHAWPLGNHDAASEADVARYFACSCTAFASQVETVSLPRRYSIQRVNVGTQTANLHSLIDTAKNCGGLIVFVIHDVVTSGATGNNMNQVDFTDLVSYLAASGIQVKTLGDALTAIGV